MTIKNKKTNKSKTSEVTSSNASTSVQKSSTSTSVQSSSSTLQKVSSGKKVRYIDVKVEEDDPLMITDVTDHASISGSTISEHYNSHPHYIITEAPSMTDLSQIRSNVSDMAQSTTGEFVSDSVQHQSSTSHQQSSNQTFQSSSSSVHQTGTSHSQSFDRTTDSQARNQTLNTGFIDNSGANVSGSTTNYTTQSRNANVSNDFLQSERESLISQTQTGTSTHAKDQNISQRENVTYRIPETPQRQKTVKSNAANLYQVDESNSNVDKNVKSTNISQKNMSTSSISKTKAAGISTNTKDQKNVNQRDTHRNSPDPSRRTVKSNAANFYQVEPASHEQNVKTYSSTSQTSENKSSTISKSTSSSYVVEIVDGKERIIDQSKREWGDAQEHSSKEAYASVSGSDIKPQSVHSIQNRDMQSNFDSGKDGQKPTSGMTLKQDSKLIKDGVEVTNNASMITEKDNVKHQQYIKGQLTDDQRQSKITSDQYTINQMDIDTKNIKDTHKNLTNQQSNIISDDRIQSTTSSDTNTINQTNKSVTENITSTHQTSVDEKRNISTTESVENINTNRQIVNDRKNNVNKTDSSNFYGYDSTIQNELRKVGDILQVTDKDNINFSTKIMKSNTSSAQQASTSSYRIEIVDGKEVMVDSTHREWGDSKDHSTHEKSHNVSGTGKQPQHEYTRHVLDKESHYDTGKNGVPTSSSQITEDSVLYKDGKKIASTSNTYLGDFTKKKAISEYVTDIDDVHNRNITDTNISTDSNVHSTTYQSSSTDTQSHVRDIKDTTKTTEFLTKEKQNLNKQTTDSQSKDTLTTYERSTGTWNGKFTYETGDDRPKQPKQVSPFGKPDQPRHHLKRQDTEENIILSSRDIKDFTSISDLRKIIESSQTRKDVKVSNNNIVIKRNIDDRVLKEIIDTVKKYPFKRIEKVSFGTKINEDVKDLYEGVDTEETTVLTTSSGETTRKSFEIQKNRSQVEVTRYITENGITRKITTYEDAKEDDKVKTDVFVDKSKIDFRNLVS